MNLSKKFLKCAAIAAIVTTSFSAVGQTINLQNQAVQRVGCGATQNACFLVLADPVVTSNCTGALVSFDATTTSGKNVLATLLTVRAGELPANLTIDDTGCNGPNPKLIALTIGNPS